MKIDRSYHYIALALFLASCGPAVVATRPPEPDVIVVQSASPGPDYVWVNGRWRYNRRAHVHQYVAPGWVAPRRRGAQWTDGRWIETRRGWKYMPGHWH